MDQMTSLSFKERFSVFQLSVLVFPTCDFTVLVHRSNSQFSVLSECLLGGKKLTLECENG